MALEQIGPHVDEIAEAIGDDVDREEIEAELERFLDYGVPLEQAKRDILREYGGRVSQERKIEDLSPGDQSVTFLARVLTVNDKEIEVEGEPRTIYFGTFADLTDTISYTAWHDFELEADSVVRVRNAYVKEFNDSPEVNLGDYTSIEPADPDLLPEDAIARPMQTLTVDGFRGDMGSVETTVRVLTLEDKEITVKGEPQEIREGEVADATGKARLTVWNDFGIEVGDVLHVESGYIRTWRGMPTLNLGDYAEVETLDDDELPPADELDQAPVVSLREVVDRGGGYDVRVRGTILEIKPGSGLIERCPECNRPVDKGQCRVHGEVDAEPDLRTKATIDDGTGAGTLILDRELTEEILDRTMEECQEQAQDAMSKEVVTDALADELVAETLEVRGNGSVDDFGLTLIGRDVGFPEIDVKADAEALLEEVS